MDADEHRSEATALEVSDMPSSRSGQRARHGRTGHAAAVIVLALLCSALHAASAHAAGLQGALAELDLTLEGLQQVQDYAERAAVARNPNQIVSWTSENILWRAQAWGEWTITSGSSRSCRSVVITARVHTRDGIEKRDIAGTICLPASARTGQRRIGSSG